MKSISLERLLFERVDLEKINAIRQTFQEIKTAILALPATPASFKRNGWETEEGKLKTLVVSELYADSAFSNLFIIFDPHNATLAWANTNEDGDLFLAFRLPKPPQEVKTKSQYNSWFVGEVKNWFQQPSSEPLFVHEFIHLLDIARIGDVFFDIVDKTTASAKPLAELTKEVQKLKAELERIPKGKPERKQVLVDLRKLASKWKEAKDRHWKEYQNSPVETNAYFNQTIAAVKEKASRALRERGKLAALSVLGVTPQEFVSVFEKELPNHIRVDLLDPKILKGFRKRAAILYDQLVDEIETGKERSLV